MKKIENECVSCGLPCLGSRCPYRNVTRFYCDRCDEEDTLYHYEGEELCKECVLEEVLEGFDVVKGSDCI